MIIIHIFHHATLVFSFHPGFIFTLLYNVIGPFAKTNRFNNNRYLTINFSIRSWRITFRLGRRGRNRMVVEFMVPGITVLFTK